MSKKQSGKIAEFGEYEIHANGVMQDGDFYRGANGFHFLAVRIAKLEAENERLREALRRIYNEAPQDGGYAAAVIAEQAMVEGE